MIGAFRNPDERRTTAWVTAADISGTGTATVESALLALPHPTTSFVDAVIEVEFDAIASVGSVYNWLRISTTGVDLTTVAKEDSPDLHTTRIRTGGTSRKRRILVSRQTIQHVASSASVGLTADTSYPRVAAAGVGASDEWAVSNIRARLIYTPVSG